jgi:hypothetical protein
MEYIREEEYALCNMWTGGNKLNSKWIKNTALPIA